MDEADPEAILGAAYEDGVSVGRTDGGDIFVNTPFGQMSWRQAVETGVLRIGRRQCPAVSITSAGQP